MRLPNSEVLKQSSRYLEPHWGPGDVTLEEKQAFIAETVEAYEKYVNRGIHLLPQVGDPGRTVRGTGMVGAGFHAARSAGPGVHRLPRRLRHLQRGDQPPEDRQGGDRPDAAHGAQQPGAAGAVARRHSPGCSQRSRRASSRTASSSTTAPTPSKAPSSSPAFTPGETLSSPRWAASTASRWDRCR